MENAQKIVNVPLNTDLQKVVVPFKEHLLYGFRSIEVAHEIWPLFQKLLEAGALLNHQQIVWERDETND